MFGTLLTYAPLIACPLGMAAMMGIPALMYRAKRRRQVVDPNGPAHDVAPRRDALPGSIAVKS
jgi:hypothetical protein